MISKLINIMDRLNGKSIFIRMVGGGGYLIYIADYAICLQKT